MKLDLHGIKHQDVQRKVDKFLWENHDNLPLTIVTGNSSYMKKIVTEILNDYSYEFRIGDFLQINDGIIELY